MPGLLAGMATHATGTAHPRQTTLATMMHSLSESVVGYMESARPPDVHSDKTHRMSGAKAGEDVCPLGQGMTLLRFIPDFGYMTWFANLASPKAC